jgi:hypothetical protein
MPASSDQPPFNISVGILRGDFHRLWYERKGGKDIRKLLFSETVQVGNQAVESSPCFLRKVIRNPQIDVVGRDRFFPRPTAVDDLC